MAKPQKIKARTGNIKEGKSHTVLDNSIRFDEHFHKSCTKWKKRHFKQKDFFVVVFSRIELKEIGKISSKFNNAPSKPLQTVKQSKWHKLLQNGDQINGQRQKNEMF